MMGRRLVLVLAAAVVVVVGGLAAWVLIGKWGGPPWCPIYVAATLRQAIGPDAPDDPWTMYSHDGARSGGAPKVTADRSSTSPGGQTPKSCRLKISAAPTSPGKDADWRMGHVFNNPAPVRGRTVTFRVQMKADAALEFDSAYIYIWDGAGWSTAPIQRVGAEWQTIEVSHRFAPDAAAFEVWIRLLFDAGTIRPADATLYFIPEVEGGTS